MVTYVNIYPVTMVTYHSTNVGPAPDGMESKLVGNHGNPAQESAEDDDPG